MPTCCRWEPRGLTVVELEHAAEPLPASDGAAADRCDLGRDKLIVQTLVRPFFMIVIDERSHRGPEVAFAEWHEPRQTLGSDRPHKSLRECVGVSSRLHRLRAVRDKLSGLPIPTIHCVAGR